jgi:hypothetical protein
MKHTKHNTNNTTISDRHARRLRAKGVNPDTQRAATGRFRTSPELLQSIGEQRRRLLTFQADSAEMEVGKARGTLVETARVLAVWGETIQRIRAMLDGKFRSELPAKQGGLPADKIAEMNGKALDDIYAELSRPVA